MKTIYFVRHGEAQANIDGVMAGSSNDSPLTQNGRLQAKAAAALVAELPVDFIIVSPMSRARETAQIIMDAIGYKGQYRTNPLFTERNFGSATGLPRSEGRKLLDSGTVIGAESIQSLHARALRAISYLRKLPYEHILVVSHNAFGRMIGATVVGMDPQDFLQHKKLANGELYEFSLE